MKCQEHGCSKLATHGTYCWACRDEALRRVEPDRQARPVGYHTDPPYYSGYRDLREWMANHMGDE